MPIPTTRAELIQRVEHTFGKLDATLAGLSRDEASLPCTAAWTVTDLLAVRVWWTEATPRWIQQGVQGEGFETPETGFRWKDTPALNQRTVDRNTDDAVQLRARLSRGVIAVLDAVEQLDDRQLLEVGVFRWAGHWPVSRWVSVNTATQYVSARKLIRAALRT